MTTEKMVKTLAEAYIVDLENAVLEFASVACPYCTEGKVLYSAESDQFTCSICCKEITGIEYEKLTRGSA